MKYVIAMIQPEKLPEVKQALFDEEVYSMTVSNALGKYFTITPMGSFYSHVVLPISTSQES